MMSRSPHNAPWLSVAMPVHDGERWLEPTLASAAAEDCRGIEFILIDSSAGAGCRAIADSFAGRLDIRYQHRRDVLPWTAKTNLAVQQARAPHVAMLHQDDLWLSGRVADVRRAIEEHPDAALMLNPSQIVDQDGRELGIWRCPLPAARPLPAESLAARLLVQNFVAIPAPVVRRDAWIAAGGLDEALWYTADWDLYLKLARQGAAVYRDSVTTAFRIHGGSLTVKGSANKADFADQMARVIDRHIDLAPPATREAIRRRALASTAVNCALAEAMGGNARALVGAFLSLLRLGPVGAYRYVRDSRIIDRALPRLRARFAGAL
jgi:glycosyltransferase involved in cell wall biosynthesis